MPLFEPLGALAAVESDLLEGFGSVFEAIEPVRAVGLFQEQAVGTTSEDASVVAWEWPVRHVGSIQGTPGTNREVVLRGITVIDGRGGGLLFARYIDWLGLYSELGAVTISRPQVDDRSMLPVDDNSPFPTDIDTEPHP